MYVFVEGHIQVFLLAVEKAMPSSDMGFLANPLYWVLSFHFWSIEMK